MFKYKIKTNEIDDGREDAVIAIGGTRLITIHQEGYRELGLTYEQAKGFVMNLGKLLVAAGNGLSMDQPKPTGDV